MDQPDLFSAVVEEEAPEETGGVAFSSDRAYRYLLLRQWDLELPWMTFIGLNPSTADGMTDDPTIRRCRNFAKDWGYGGFKMVNLFAFRATEPTDMLHADNPIGTMNDHHIKTAVRKSSFVLACWGQHGSYFGRSYAVRCNVEKIKQLHCLGQTNAGEPRHPLYIKSDTTPVLYQ